MTCNKILVYTPTHTHSHTPICNSTVFCVNVSTNIVEGEAERSSTRGLRQCAKSAWHIETLYTHTRTHSHSSIYKRQGFEILHLLAHCAPHTEGRINEQINKIIQIQVSKQRCRTVSCRDDAKRGLCWGNEVLIFYILRTHQWTISNISTGKFSLQYTCDHDMF